MNLNRRSFIILLTASACQTVPAGSGNSVDVSAEALGFVNQFRAMHNAPPLSINADCVKAAKEQALLMAKTGKMVHDTSARNSFTLRRRRAGIILPAGENIAYGQPDIPSVIKARIESPEHRENMANPKYRGFGQAWARHSNTQDTIYWAQVFSG